MRYMMESGVLSQLMNAALDRSTKAWDTKKPKENGSSVTKGLKVSAESSEAGTRSLHSPMTGADDDGSIEDYISDEADDGCKTLGVRKTWSFEEDDLLARLIQKHGPREWAQIAQHFEARSAKQCHQRWHYCLDPKINRGGWTATEDRLILKYQKLHGNQWSKIAKLMTGRTGYAVRNRYNGIMKKAKLVTGRKQGRFGDATELASEGSEGDMASEIKTSRRDSKAGIKKGSSSSSTPSSIGSKHALSPHLTHALPTLTTAWPSPWHENIDQKRLPEAPPFLKVICPPDRFAGLLELHRSRSDGEPYFQHADPRDVRQGLPPYTSFTSAIPNMPANQRYAVSSPPSSHQQHIFGDPGTRGISSSVANGCFSKVSPYVPPHYDTVREQASSSYRAAPPSTYLPPAETASAHAYAVSLLRNMAAGGRSAPRSSSSPALPSSSSFLPPSK